MYFFSSHEEGPTSKKLKTEEREACFSISSLAEGSVTSVSRTFPGCSPPLWKVGMWLGRGADCINFCQSFNNSLSLVLLIYEPCTSFSHVFLYCQGIISVTHVHGAQYNMQHMEQLSGAWQHLGQRFFGWLYFAASVQLKRQDKRRLMIEVLVSEHVKFRSMTPLFSFLIYNFRIGFTSLRFSETEYPLTLEIFFT